MDVPVLRVNGRCADEKQQTHTDPVKDVSFPVHGELLRQAGGVAEARHTPTARGDFSLEIAVAMRER